MEAFATLLHQYRKAAGLTQQDLADRSGTSLAAIGALERGVRKYPRPETITALAHALRLRPEDRQALTQAARRKGKPAAQRDNPASGTASRGPLGTAGPGGAGPGSAGPGSADAAGQPGGSDAAVPRQLPLVDAGFTGRSGDLGVLRAALTRESGVAIVGITGMGGVGKTTLAVKAAHEVTEEYPGGQVYLDLRGYGTDSPVSPLEALNYLLRAFGLSGPDVPVQVDEAAARLRTLLATRRALILLDNARDAAQVEYLVPGTGRSAVLITSRQELSGMPAAQILRLGLMSAPEGLGLLKTTVGGDRVDQEPEAARSILDSCGLLPLALKISAGRLAARPRWPLTHLAGLLRDERSRLDHLQDQELGVRASFDVSIDDLAASQSGREQRAAAAFALFGVPDGPDLTVEVAARLLDCDERAATDALEDLCDLHLLESLAPRRYRLHDLLRMYARERAQATISADERAAALTRILDLYASAGWQSIELGFPKAGRVPWYRAQPPIANGGPEYQTMGAALSWLDGQRPHLVAVMAQAVRTPGVPAVSILRLAIGLHTFYATRGHWMDCLQVFRAALEVATDDPCAEGHLRTDLGLVLLDLARVGAGRPEESIAELHRAVALFEGLGDLRGAATALVNLSHVLHLNGDYQQAIDAGHRALAIYRQLGDLPDEAIAHFNIGNSEGRLGRTAAQRSAYDEAIAISNRYDAQHHLATALLGSGIAYREAGDFAASFDHLHQAVAKFRTADDQLGLAEALDELGVTYRLAGDPKTSIGHHDEALTISTHYDDGQRHVLILHHLALAHEAAGDRSIATTHLQEALTVAAQKRLPDLTPLQEDLARLTKESVPD
ncbi:tetratricopeptide repeat protein [Kribbella sp. CA-294648]|uniref:tetratricopeptide repeat protein n=1 Tax=Kribbella sp. CA-294648 TaxID=3239948 RepID=UPI003D8D7571